MATAGLDRWCAGVNLDFIKLLGAVHSGDSGVQDGVCFPFSRRPRQL